MRQLCPGCGADRVWLERSSDAHGSAIVTVHPESVSVGSLRVPWISTPVLSPRMSNALSALPPSR